MGDLKLIMMILIMKWNTWIMKNMLKKENALFAAGRPEKSIGYMENMPIKACLKI